MTLKKLVLMLLVGMLVQVLANWILRHWFSVPQSMAIALWLMAISWWPFVRKLPINKNVHVGFYIAAALVVSTCAVIIAYYL